MKIGIGLTLLFGGVGIAVITWIVNSQTPTPVGPIPFFAGCIFALIGLILFVSAL